MYRRSECSESEQMIRWSKSVPFWNLSKQVSSIKFYSSEIIFYLQMQKIKTRTFSQCLIYFDIETKTLCFTICSCIISIWILGAFLDSRQEFKWAKYQCVKVPGGENSDLVKISNGDHSDWRKKFLQQKLQRKIFGAQKFPRRNCRESSKLNYNHIEHQL